MPIDIAPHLDPDRCALVVFECQEFIVGPESHLPGLAASVRDGDVLAHIAQLIEAARAANVTVVYCTFDPSVGDSRPSLNTPLALRMRASGEAHDSAPTMGDVIGVLAPAAGDVVLARGHGLTGFSAGDLDAHLSEVGVETVVLTGVSVNIGVLGTAIEAVNRGYTVVVPTDCVASDPPEYAESVLRYTVRNIALLSTASEVAVRWGSSA